MEDGDVLLLLAALMFVSVITAAILMTMNKRDEPRDTSLDE